MYANKLITKDISKNNFLILYTALVPTAAAVTCKPSQRNTKLQFLPIIIITRPDNPIKLKSHDRLIALIANDNVCLNPDVGIYITTYMFRVNILNSNKVHSKYAETQTKILNLKKICRNFP